MFFCHFWNSIRSENNCESQYCVCERAHYDKFILCVAFVLKQNANAIHENEKVKYVMIEKHAHSIFGMRYIFNNNNNNIMSATQLWTKKQVVKHFYANHFRCNRISRFFAIKINFIVFRLVRRRHLQLMPYSLFYSFCVHWSKKMKWKELISFLLSLGFVAQRITQRWASFKRKTKGEDRQKTKKNTEKLVHLYVNECLSGYWNYSFVVMKRNIKNRWINDCMVIWFSLL